MIQRSTLVALAERGIPLIILAACLVFIPIAGKERGSASSIGLQLTADAMTGTVAAGQTATFRAIVTNSADADQPVALEYRLPEGFSYVPYSTEVRRNGALVSTQEPMVVGNAVRWLDLSVPPRRTGTHYGMHTFVQDRCNEDYIRTQLDRVLHVAGPGAYVKQLLYRIDTNTPGPASCWVYFVNRCYDMGLVPVVRLGTDLDGANWRKPEPYGAMAEAYKRVVAGLPRRDGHKLYVEIGNEPNLNMEWGGAANGAEYGQFLVEAAAALRSLQDPRIVLLNGGLSPTGHMADAVGGGMSTTAFIEQMATVPGALQAFDVWASHPYPGNRPPEQNLHDGTAADYAFLAIDSYLLELDCLAKHGRTGLQVLLTETGYPIGAKDLEGPLGLPEITEANRADYIARAFRDYWSRWPEVIGVCPFFLMDPMGDSSPWRDWVWMDNEAAPRQQYHAVAALPKAPADAPGTLTVTFRATAAGWAGTYNSGAALVDGAGGRLEVSAVAPLHVTGPTRPAGDVVCYEALANGGFETDAGWEFPETAAPGGYSIDRAHSGSRAARIGLTAGSAGTSYSSGRQTVTLPSNTVSAELSLWYYPESRDVAHGRQYVWLLDAQGNRIGNALWAATDARAWQQVGFNLLGYAGQPVTLHLGAFFHQGYEPIGLYVDDVSLRVCTAGEPERPETPTPVVPPPGGQGVRLPVVMREGRVVATAAASRGPSLGHRERPTLQNLTPEDEDAAAAVLAADRAAAAAATPAVRPTPTPRWVPTDDGQVEALTLDAPRGRILATSGRTLRVHDLEGGVRATAELPHRIGAVALDASDGSAYLALPDGGTIMRLDEAGLAMVAEGLGRPLGLAVTPGRLFAGDADGKRLVMLDRQGRGIMQEIDLEAAPGGLVYDPLMHRIYVTQLGPGTLLACNADTLEPLGQVTLGGLGLPRALALDAEARRLYVAHDLSPKYGVLSVVDTATWQVIAERTGTWTQPLAGCDDLVIDRERGRLVLGHHGGIVTLDLETLEVIEETQRPPTASARGLALDPATGRAYLGADGDGLWRTGPELHIMQALP
jgi:hypothetical protein